MIPKKMVQRIEHLETSNNLVQKDLVDVKDDINAIMTNHLPHIQAAVDDTKKSLKELVLHSWLKFLSELIGLGVVITTLVIVLKHH